LRKGLTTRNAFSFTVDRVCRNIELFTYIWCYR